MLADLIGIIHRYGRRVTSVTLVVVGATAILSLAYFLWLQPTRQISILEFRPTFAGIEKGEYPNGLPFAGSDIVAPAVLDAVFDGNSLEQYCPRSNFKTGFYVDERSDRSAALDAEYQAKLAEVRLSPVERQTLQAEYQAKRDALPNEFRLIFVLPTECQNIPRLIVTKIMSDVLVTWATDSDQRRGVLKHQVQVLTPAILDVGAGLEQYLVLRADLVRRSILRVVSNIREVQAIPGAALIRSGTDKLTFQEIDSKLADLVRSTLEPLVISAGQSMVMESETWVTETLAVAEREQRLYEGRAAATQRALQEYSGFTQTPQSVNGSGESSSPGGSDVRNLTTQVDSSFIDRIVAMSEANIEYRQKLTDAMLEAKDSALEAESRVSYYKRFLSGVRQSQRNQMSPSEVNQRLAQIVEQAKALTKEYNLLYDEFSRVSLRPAAGMYQTKKPVSTETYRGFTIRHALLLTVGVLLITLLLAFVFFLLRDRLKEQRLTGA